MLSVEDLIKVGNRYDSRIEPYLRMAEENELDALQLDDERAMGYTLKTMAAALWCVYHSRSFEEGLLAVINEGGDADTNGAVAGSLLGAKFGYARIPVRYVEGLARRAALEDMAEDLIKVLPTIK